MNLNRKNNLITSFIFIILIFTTISVYNNLSTAQKEQESRYDLSGYVTSDPLYIDNDSDLEGNSTSGTGVEGDPWVIENLSIITTNLYGIYISSTTEYFVIRDCFIDANGYGIYIYNAAWKTVEIDNNTVYLSGTGIRIIDSDTATITNNYCDDNEYGIQVEYADQYIVSNNTCINGDQGIYANNADYSHFRDNNLIYNTQYGMWLSQGDYCFIIENNCSFNDYSGIYVVTSLYSTIEDNVCHNNYYHGIYTFMDTGATISFNLVYNNDFNGIIVQTAIDDEITNNTVYANGGVGIFNDGSTGTAIESNTLTNDGFHISMSSIPDYAALTITDNTVNGKPLGFYYALGEMALSSGNFGQLILVGCSGTLVKDFTIRDTDNALFLIGCDSVIVDNCNFNYNFAGSVFLDGTMNCTISNTLCSHTQSKSGLYAGGAIDTVIKNCTVSNNDYGIQFVSSTNFSILECTMNQNAYFNARLFNGAAGNIRYNAFTNCGSVGLQLLNIDYVNISHNLFESNANYALYLDSNSMFNWIHHNAFISNNLGGTSQAFDDTADLNMWDDPWNMEGNYWDDWVSGNYTIDGLGQANDSYPYGSIPPGVGEFNQYSIYFVLLIPAVVVSVSIYRKRKK